MEMVLGTQPVSGRFPASFGTRRNLTTGFGLVKALMINNNAIIQ